jgi:ABC-type thiamin/hydroxymethylpyrimidine transport system permease subunit
MKKFEIRDWVYIGLFGALWGVLELSLGTILHVIFPPLANTFFTGLIMASIGCIVALTGRSFVPKPWSIALIGVVTALLKLISPGGVKLGPVVAIVIESLLMEAGTALFGRRINAGFITAGILALIWNFLHRFVMLRILFGKKLVEVATMMVKSGSRMLGIDERHVLAIIAILFTVSLAAGVFSAFAALKLGGEIRKRVELKHEG